MMKPAFLCLLGAFACLGCPDGRSFTSECSDNSDCAATEFCAGGLCDGGVGICSERPTECDDEIRESCACDGETYRNLCTVRQLGLRVAFVAGCPCEGDASCGDGLFCASDGTCELPGNCNFIREDCDDRTRPVCGCDDETYLNECSAKALAVSIADDRAGCECDNDAECTGDGYCVLDDCSSPGTCSFAPTTCDDDIDVVCGCDGITYRNECMAQMAKVSIDDPSEGCPCDDDGQCGTGQYCAQDDGCEATGACNIPPVECPDFAEAVCGCDGVTYLNSCVAQMMEVSLDSRFSDGCPCGDNTDCGAGQYCALGDKCGVVDGGDPMGTCDFRPADCEGEPDEPVCGCDDVTYDNECEANLAGVTVATDGACP